MFDFESEATKNIMQLKTNIQNGENMTMETLDILLAVYLSKVKEVKMLEKQLYYALETGGKYLEVDSVVQ